MKYKHSSTHQNTSLKTIIFYVAICFTLLCFCTSAYADSCNHSSTTWKRESPDVIIGLVTTKKVCNTCGKVLDYDYTAIAMTENSQFIFSPNQFAERLDRMFSVLNKYYDASKYSAASGIMDNDELICTVRNSSYNGVAGIQFTDKKNLLKKDSENKSDISCIMAYFLSDDAAVFADVAVGVVLTCDSSLEVSDASAIVKKAFLSSAEGKSYKHNGISYAFTPASSGYLFVASLLNK